MPQRTVYAKIPQRVHILRGLFGFSDLERSECESPQCRPQIALPGRAPLHYSLLFPTVGSAPHFSIPSLSPSMFSVLERCLVSLRQTHTTSKQPPYTLAKSMISNLTGPTPRPRSLPFSFSFSRRSHLPASSSPTGQNVRPPRYTHTVEGGSHFLSVS